MSLNSLQFIIPKKKELQKELLDNKKSFEYIFNSFENCNIENIYKNINNIKNLLKNIKINEKKILINEIQKKTEIFIENKKIVSTLKSLLIECYKTKPCEEKIITLKNISISENSNTNINNQSHDINSITKLLEIIHNENNASKINYYIKKYYKNNLKNIINCKKLIVELENKFYNSSNNNSSNNPIINTNSFILLKLINIFHQKYNNLVINNKNENNKNKVEENDYLDPFGDSKNDIIYVDVSNLEKCLYNIDKNIYEYIFFINNKINESYSFQDKISIINFIEKIGYISKKFEDIDALNLKRGFIQGIICNNTKKDYLLKYQPNKSVMELIINIYLKTINDNQYFLLPKYIFINRDNSYFYFIKKYNVDLNKYFNILEKNKKLFLLQDIIDIIYFLLNGTKLLHKNNIIHGDLKLENIVVKVNNNNEIIDKKIIDFDVSLFNIVPENIKNISKKLDKILNNKTPRGTKTYMFKDELMSPNSDIYSIGVIALVLLYKSVKLMLFLYNKQKNNNDIKKLSIIRKTIDNDKEKIKMLNKIEKIVINKKYTQFHNNNIKLFMKLKLFIIECINIDNKYTTDEILFNYHEIFFNKKIESVINI